MKASLRSLYGGTERVVSHLTEELVRMGHDVTLFASADSETSAHLAPGCGQALWRDPECGETLPQHVHLVEMVFKQAVRQNLGIIIVPNAIAILLGAFGIIGPPMAAIINNGATFLAVAVGTIPLLRKKPELKPGPALEKPQQKPASNPGKLPAVPATTRNPYRLRAVAVGEKG
jgi:hypothetical protein